MDDIDEEETEKRGRHKATEAGSDDRRRQQRKERVRNEVKRERRAVTRQHKQKWKLGHGDTEAVRGKQNEEKCEKSDKERR